MKYKIIAYILLIALSGIISAGCLKMDTQKTEDGIMITTHTDILNPGNDYEIINNTNDFPVAIVIVESGKSKRSVLGEIILNAGEKIKIQYSADGVNYTVTKSKPQNNATYAY